MPKKNEKKPETVVIVKDDNYFEARLSRMPQAIKDMPEGQNKMMISYVYSEVLGESQLSDDKQRYESYRHLLRYNDRFDLNAVDRVRSADPNKNAWVDLSIAQATQLLNDEADYTGFTQMRTNKEGVREPLTSQYLIEYLSTNYQRNNKYDKNTNYTTPTPEVTE